MTKLTHELLRWRIEIASIVYLLMLLVTPALAAGQRCLDIPTGPLEVETKAGKPVNDVVEALVHDAETIYADGAHIVDRKPRTDVESLAISRMEKLHDFGEAFHVKECHFAQAYVSIINEGNYGYQDPAEFILERLQDFDTYIFHAVTEAQGCSNDKAAFHLKLARLALDHAQMELTGKTDERTWKPDETNTPQGFVTCTAFKGRSPEELERLVQDQIQRYRKAASSR